jgi:hypothetical protein
MPSTAGRRNMSNWQDEREKRNRQSIARLTRALPGIFPSNVLSRALSHPFVPPMPRLAIESYWRAHPICADRRPARSLPAAERPATGPSGLATSARADCQPHSEHRPRRIVSTRTHGGRGSVACVANRFIASAGTLTFGTSAPTRMPAGTVPASSPGNSGMRRVARPSFWGVCKRAAAARPADGYGTPPGPAVPGLERTSRHAVAGIAAFLGIAQPSGD